MATPITWQNINAPSLADASRPLEAAQRSFNGMFGELGNVLAQRQQVDERNWQNTRNNNTQAFLDRLASFRTPEELAAAQQSGALDQLRQKFGPQIDNAAIRGAADQRMGALRTNTRQAGEFQDWSTDRAQAGDVEQAKQLIANKDFAGARALLGQKDLRQESALWSNLTAAERGQVLEGQQDTRFQNDQTRFGWDGQMQPLNLEAKRTDIAQGNQSILESRARISDMGQRRELTKLEIEARKEAGRLGKGSGALQDKAYAEAVANSPYSAGSYDTAAGKKSLMEHIKTAPNMDQADIADITYNLQKYYKDGVTVGMDEKGKPIKAPLPVNVIMDAIDQSTDNPLAIGFSRRGDDVARIIRERFGVDSEGYQRPDTLAKADRETIEGIQFIKKLQADRLNRLKSSNAPTKTDNPFNK